MDDARPPPLTEIGAALARVEALAVGVGRRTRFWGWMALAAAPAIWAIVLRRWVFDSWGGFLGWLPVLLVLMAPGVILLGFGARMKRIAGLRARVSGEAAALVAAARSDLAAELEQAGTSGIAGLRSLIGSLGDLRSYAGEAGEIVTGVVGTVRLLNPIYLLIVLGAAVAAGLLAMLLLGAILLLLVA